MLLPASTDMRMTRKLADPDRSGKNLIVSLPGIHSEHLNSTMTRYFVSRHPGAVTWAKRQGIHVDRIIDHLDIALIHSGDTVIGTLPVNLAAEVCRRGARYLHLSLNLPAELRG